MVFNVTNILNRSVHHETKKCMFLQMDTVISLLPDPETGVCLCLDLETGTVIMSIFPEKEHVFFLNIKLTKKGEFVLLHYLKKQMVAG